MPQSSDTFVDSSPFRVGPSKSSTEPRKIKGSALVLKVAEQDDEIRLLLRSVEEALKQIEDQGKFIQQLRKDLEREKIYVMRAADKIKEIDANYQRLQEIVEYLHQKDCGCSSNMYRSEGDESMTKDLTATD